MIVGTAIIPSAPLLVPGVSATRPDGVGPVCDAVDAVLESLPDHDTVVLLAAAPGGEPNSRQGLYDGADASLAGVGRPDIARSAPIDRRAVEWITRISQYPMYRGEALPLSLAVLALLVDGGALVPMAVPQRASFESLAAIGSGIARALDEVIGARAVVVAAGDLSAGLDEASPLYRIDAAADWDAQVRDVVASGRLDGLQRLGPAEAQRVGALGWAPMAVLHGVTARAKIGLVLRHYAAPRGVGYLVAQGS